MPPTLASILTLGFIAFLFWRDIRERPNVTGALWIPILWMFVIASRPASQWLSIFGLPGYGARSIEEGSSLDASVYFTLIAAGLYVLYRRHASLSAIFRENGWLMAFLLYCFVTILWSDYPFLSFKRWIKYLGHPIMVLVVFSEPDPQEALVRLFKRNAYVLIPVSILFIKYYPNLGREAGQWATQQSNCGIADGKNQLGSICLFVGFFFVWHLLQVWRTEKGKARRDELLLIGSFLLMIAWLLRKAHSATALVSLLVAIFVMVLLGMKGVNKKLVGAYTVAGIIMLVIAQLTLETFDTVVDLTGHESTMEGREVLWGQLLAVGTNPIFGVGYESFWLGDWVADLSEGRVWLPNEAHNGYLETYLNTGLVGLFILIGVIIAAFRKIRLELLRNFDWGRFRMGLLAAIIARNWTEAGFGRLSLSFFVFFIIAIDYLPLRFSIAPAVESSESPDEGELVYTPGTV